MANQLQQGRTIHTLVFGTALTLTIAGCATQQYPITSPYYRIPPGTRIVLNEALIIPPNTARVYLQNGKVVSPGEKDRYQPNCWFLSWKLSETTPQEIHPDTFIVTQTQKNEDYVQNFSKMSVASATVSTEVGVGVGIGVGAGNHGMFGPFSGDVPIATEYTTDIYIQSDTQPDIRRLACSHWDDVHTGEHLTVEQMQTALGKIATIQIADLPRQ